MEGAESIKRSLKHQNKSQDEEENTEEDEANVTVVLEPCKIDTQEKKRDRSGEKRKCTRTSDRHFNCSVCSEDFSGRSKFTTHACNVWSQSSSQVSSAEQTSKCTNDKPFIYTRCPRIRPIKLEGLQRGPRQTF